MASPPPSDRPRVFVTGPNHSESVGRDGPPRDVTEAGSLATPEALRYERLASLGVGGMGRVDIARDGRLMRQVALKTARASTHDAAARLTQEALITAHLDHPNIVPLFDAGVTDEGDVFYTMRLVRGRSLEAALDECDDLKQRLGHLRHYLATCEAMAYAHAAGVVHRDLKPDNVMIGDYGETQIVDWGVAKPLGTAQGNAWRREVLTEDVAVETQYHEIIGTPSYMAPEQATPHAEPTVAADIFGLGAILYRLLTGHAPFRGSGTTAELLGRVRRNAFEPLAAFADRGYPPELVAISERAMRFDPEERYESAEALARDVAAWLDGRRVDAYAYSPWESLKRIAAQWRVPLFIVAVATIVLATIAIFAAERIVRERDTAQAAEERAAANEALAEARLADALISQAARHLQEGRGAEAELAAATAATYGARPDPRAIGILMATVGAYGPSAVGTTTLPGPCPRPAISPAGDRVLCSDANQLSMYALKGAHFRLAWQRSVTHSWATFGPFDASVGARDLVTVVDASRSPMQFRADTGEAVAVRRRPGIPDAVHVGARTATMSPAPEGNTPVVFYAGWEAAVFDTGGLGAPTRICHGSLIEAAAIRGVVVAFACSDGTFAMARADIGGALRELRTLGTKPTAGATPDLAPGYVATLNQDGLIATITPRGRLQLRDADSSRTLETGVVGATSLAFSPDSGTIAIQSINAGVYLVRIADDGFGRAVARLPRGHGRALTWTNDGITTVGDKTITRWAIPELGPAHIYGQTGDGVRDGLSSLDVAGDRLIFAGGDGRVGLCSIADRDCVESRPLRSVIKRVRFATGATSYRMCSSEVPGMRELDLSTGLARGAGGSLPLRRIEALTGGGWVGASWEKSPWLVAADETMTSALPAAESASDLDVFEGRDVLYLAENTWSLFLTEGTAATRAIAHVPGARAVALGGDLVAVAFEAEIAVLNRAGMEVTRWPLPGLTPTDLDWFGNNLFVGHRDGSLEVWATDPDGHFERIAVMPAIEVGHAGRVGEVMTRDDALWSAGWDGVVKRWSREPLSVDSTTLLKNAKARWALDEKAQ